ncbi:MAG TPA: MlaD family protein [Bacteroidales bacterium]|nr:MlaD family protein [Bacteroidales bacterium]
MKLTREFKIGLIVTAAMALLYWGFNFLKGEDIFTNDRVFYAVYDDVAGLQKSNPVKINGLNVGRVRDMFFADNGGSKVVVEMILNNDIYIPDNSTAKISSSDLLGSKEVELKLGNSSVPAQSGDTLMSEMEVSIKEEVNRQIAPIKNKAEELMSSIDTVLTMLQGIFSSANADNFSKSVLHIANSFENLEKTTSSLDTLMTGERSRIENILFNIESITENLKNNEEQINIIVSNFSAMSDTLARVNFAQTMSNVNHTMSNLASITEKINQGEGSMGMLINNDSLYIELEKSSKDLNLLLEDIRLNPKKYVKFSVF